MIEAGDVYLADLNEKQHRRVLVMSVSRFNRLSDRVIVAPELRDGAAAVEFPWRIEVDDVLFALDLVRSLPAERLLDQVGRAVPETAATVRRVLHTIL